MIDLQEQAKIFKRARLDADLSAKDLAELICEEAGVRFDPITLSQQAISNFENGKTKNTPRWVRYAVEIFAAHNVLSRRASEELQKAIYRNLEAEWPSDREVDDVEQALLDEVADLGREHKESLFRMLKHLKEPKKLSGLHAFFEDEGRWSADLTDDHRHLLSSFDRLNDEDRAALVQIAHSMAGKREVPTIHSPRTAFHAEAAGDR